MPNSEMSAPAMKVRPPQMMTTALTAPFASAASTPRLRPSRTACDSAFTGGESIVTTATSPSIARSATELIAAIGCFLRHWLDGRRRQARGARDGLQGLTPGLCLKHAASPGQLPGGGALRSAPVGLAAELKKFAVFVTLPLFVRIGVAEGAKGLRDRQTGEVENADTSNGSERRPGRDRERKSPARSGAPGPPRRTTSSAPTRNGAQA